MSIRDTFIYQGTQYRLSILEDSTKEVDLIC